jgi:alpha-amylase/alpha-mannosidase (GH57 family)
MKPVRLAILWHMHQPLYREPATGTYVLPWVRLHATRAYNDMAWILERHPGVRVTVNFTPVLLEQLEDYAAGRARDALLDLSARDPDDLAPEERRRLLHSFFMVDWDRSVRTVPRYLELLEKRGRDLDRVDLDEVATTFTRAELRDLQVHFNLAWMGFGALADDPALREVAARERDFDDDAVALVLGAQRRIVAGVFARWRALADRGQIELSTTPHHHPILPLVCDSDAAARALPGVALPPRFAWPDDARRQVADALRSHERRFGRVPAGMWPAEGAVSPEALEILAGQGVSWAASDEGVLLRSLPPGSPRAASLYRPWRVAAGEREISMLFRDRSISDLIGFSYARVPAADAVADFTNRVVGAGEAWRRDGQQGPATVGVFLDGENAWERYPRSGHDFLDALHRAIGSDARLETVTLSEATAGAAGPPIARIHSGSWIEASYRIWIGHREDRLAWTAVGKAREAVEAARAAGAPTEKVEHALRHLRAAEGSDWYWWYGEDFATENAAEFDALFRGHVLRACELLDLAPPAEALQPIKPTGRGALEAKALREPTSLIRPVIDGRDPDFFEWQGAGLHRPGRGRGAMFGGAPPFTALYWGFDEQHLFLRLDPEPDPTAPVADRIRVTLLGPRGPSRVEFPVVADGVSRPGRRNGDEIGRAVQRKIVEIEVPMAPLGIQSGDELVLSVEALREESEVERIPRSGYLPLSVPGADFERIHWRV